MKFVTFLLYYRGSLWATCIMIIFIIFLIVFNHLIM